MIVLAALIMFFEEWLWDKLTSFMEWVARLPALRGLEARIAALPPYPAMAVFLLPGLLLPVNIFAVWLTANGHALAGTAILIAAKLAGTAILARLFAVCRPSLLTVRWFRRLYEGLVHLKTRLYAAIKSMPAWMAVVRWKNAIKLRVAKFVHRWRGGHFKRRWKAVKYLIKQRRKRRRAAEQEEPRRDADDQMIKATLQRDWERDPSRSLLLLSLIGGAAVTGRGPVSGATTVPRQFRR